MSVPEGFRYVPGGFRDVLGGFRRFSGSPRAIQGLSGAQNWHLPNLLIMSETYYFPSGRISGVSEVSGV